MAGGSPHDNTAPSPTAPAQVPIQYLEYPSDIGYSGKDSGMDGNTVDIEVNIVEQSPDIARGVNRKIKDRLDLTLECIRRFYSKEDSPLSDTFQRYSQFFD